MGFNLLYNTPLMKSIGERRSLRISDAPPEDFRSLLSVQDALDHMEAGWLCRRCDTYAYLFGSFPP